jgi:hypothetical protein
MPAARKLFVQNEFLCVQTITCSDYIHRNQKTISEAGEAMEYLRG